MDPITLTAILGGLNLLSGGIGLAGSAKANNKIQDALTQQQGKIDSMFLPEMNQRYLDTEQAQSFLSTLRDRLNDNIKKADQTAEVTGGTPESALAAKKNATSTYADALNKLAGLGTQYKQNLKAGYANATSNLFNTKLGFLGNKSQSGANLFSNSLSNIGDLSKMFVTQ